MTSKLHPARILNDETIVPIAIPGIHERFLAWFSRRMADQPNATVLDVGAGHGAMTQALHRAGYAVSACDKFPEFYRYSAVPCSRADFVAGLPFAEASFDALVACEITEHMHDHGIFFKACARVLKPGGRMFISTPNILSLKSRFRFLTTGYPYTFGPLDKDRDDGLQHVASLSFDQYAYVARRAGLDVVAYEMDMLQRSSIGLLPLMPLLWIATLWNKVRKSEHNRMKLLLGRILFVEFVRKN